MTQTWSRRHRPIDDGFELLRLAVPRAMEPPGTNVAAWLAGHLRDEAPEDDISVLFLRRDQTGTGRS